MRKGVLAVASGALISTSKIYYTQMLSYVYKPSHMHTVYIRR